MREGSSTRPYVRCKTCGCRTGNSWDRDKVVTAWNHRGTGTWSPPVPYRLTKMPEMYYETGDSVLADDDEQVKRTRMRALLRVLYSQGYQDGYNDGHTDAEHGHDLRCMAEAT